ncbi:MAG: type II CRISPR RNA-guided endonuclease Cas9 [Hyphomonadaceae bacterium]
MTRALRFAFDVGTNSIGWAVLAGQDRKGAKQADQGADFDLAEIVAAGARIYSDGRNPKDGSSLAEMRRGPRSARRRRDRLLQRKRKVTTLLRSFGLLPIEPLGRTVRSAPSPYVLRARGLDAALTPEEFGRVLLHLNQRRGFKSNRKTDGADKNKGPLKEAMKRLEERLAASKARTLGELLARTEQQGARFETVRNFV